MCYANLPCGVDALRGPTRLELVCASSLAHRVARAAQVKCLQRADEDAFLDRVNMYSSFYVAIRKA